MGKKKDTAQLVPLDGRVIVQHILKDERSEGGIIVPRQEQERTMVARVFATGGSDLFEVGDKVILPMYCGSDVSFDGLHLSIVREEDIFAVVEDD